MKKPKVILLSNDNFYKIKERLLINCQPKEVKDIQKIFKHIENMKIKFSYDAWEVFQDGFERGKKHALKKKKEIT